MSIFLVIISVASFLLLLKIYVSEESQKIMKEDKDYKSLVQIIKGDDESE